jgi:hypothetical protein
MGPRHDYAAANVGTIIGDAAYDASEGNPPPSMFTATTSDASPRRASAGRCVCPVMRRLSQPSKPRPPTPHMNVLGPRRDSE